MSDLILAIKGILDVGWSFLIDVDVPGLGVPFAYLFIGIFVAVLGLRILGWALGLSGAAGNSDTGTVEIGWVDNTTPRLPGRK